MHFTDDEIETIRCLIYDWGFEYSLRSNREKVEALGRKIGAPGSEQARVEAHVSHGLLELFREVFHRTGGLPVGSKIGIRLPSDYDASVGAEPPARRRDE